MSMAVDPNKPLTREERGYLAERGRYDEINRLDERNGTTPEPLGDGDGTGVIPVSLLTADQQAAEKDRLLARLKALGVDVPATGTATDENAPDDELDPYEVWDVKELDAELGRRGLPKTGTKPDKVKRLEEDDKAAQA